MSIIYPRVTDARGPQIKFCWSNGTVPENYSATKASHMPTLEIDCEKLINSLISGRTLTSGPSLLLKRRQQIYSSTYSLTIIYNLNFYIVHVPYLLKADGLSSSGGAALIKICCSSHIIERKYLISISKFNPINKDETLFGLL